ncbi:MAG: hypothetical protein IRZ08_16215 [Frankia sp.]|nr:hypothetical protein [Frankia sp.]
MGKGKHRDDDASDDSGSKGGGKHRDKAPKCPRCDGDKVVRQNIDNMNEILTCPICRGTGTA